eukprot:74288_1
MDHFDTTKSQNVTFRGWNSNEVVGRCADYEAGVALTSKWMSTDAVNYATIQYTLNIIKIEDDGEFAIAITTFDDPKNTDPSLNLMQHVYLFGPNRQKARMEAGEDQDSKDGIKFEAGDELKMKIDFVQAKLSVSVNGNEKTLFNNIKTGKYIKYKLMVVLNNRDAVRITNVEQMNSVYENKGNLNEFDETTCKFVTISGKNNNRVRGNGSKKCFAFASKYMESISLNVLQYTLDIVQMEDEEKLCIGISTTNDVDMDPRPDKEPGPKEYVYMFGADGTNLKVEKGKEHDSKCNVKFKRGDRVKLKIDFEEAAFLATVNDGDEQVVFQPIVMGKYIKYIFLCVMQKGDSIEIANVEEIVSGETKENEVQCCWKSNSIDDSKLITSKCNHYHMVKSSGRSWKSAYGQWSVPSTSNLHCLWDLKIVNGKNTLVGITSNPKTVGPFHRNKNDINYCYRAWEQETFCKYSKGPKYGSLCQADHKMTVDLDLRKGTLGFCINGEYQGVAYKVIQKYGVEYSLACSLSDSIYSTDDQGTVEVLNVRCLSPDEDISYLKEQQEAKFKQRIANLEKELKAKDEAMKEQENKYKKRIVDSETQIQTKTDLNLKLEEQNKFYVMKEKQLNETISNLVKKQKQLESEISTLKIKSVLFPSVLTPIPAFSTLLSNINIAEKDETKSDDVNDDTTKTMQMVKYLKDPNEGCWHLIKKWYAGDITRHNFGKIMLKKILTCGFEKFGSFVGGLLGFAIGGIPASTVAVAIGWLLGKMAGLAASKLYKVMFPEKKTKEQKIMKEALDMFGFKEEDIYRSSVFNERILKQKFHELARKTHANSLIGERNDKKFIELNNHYDLLKTFLNVKPVEEKPISSPLDSLNSLLKINSSSGYYFKPTIRGLINNSELNGMSINVDNFIQNKNRWTVSLLNPLPNIDYGSLVKSVKPCNIVLNMMFN